MSDLMERDNYLQIAVPAWRNGRDHNTSDPVTPDGSDDSGRAERSRSTGDVHKLLHWIPRLLVVLVLLCLAFAAWVWCDILWGL